MKTKFKKIFSVFAALALAAGITGGCGKDAPKENGELELSIHMNFFGYCVFNNEWPVFEEAAKKTGVRLKGTATEMVSDSSQAFSTMLADKTLPDIIHYVGNDLKKFGVDGGLIPLEDLIDKYAPNIKKYFEDCPEAKLAATATDGHIYYIPGTLAPVDEHNLPSEGFFIRKDWLDKLGLSEPKTVEEYYNVLKAFKTQDPNGNGKDDEIPYFDRSGAINDLYQLFGAEGGYYLNENGEYVDGRTEENFKNAMKELSKWYQEGIIDKEIYTRGQQAREQLLSSNLGGSTHDWFSSTAAYNDKYPEVEGLNFVPIAPPADVNGRVKERMGRSILHGLGWGISKDNKHVEETIKYFDWWLSEEGIKLRSCGVEGKDYTMENGEIKFADTVLNADGGVPGYLRNQGCVEIGSIALLDPEIAGMNKIGKDGFNMYKDNGYILEQPVLLSFNEEEQEVIDKNQNNIDTYCNEQVQKWIMGAEKVDDTWDKYTSTLKSMNIDEVVKVYNSAYSRYKKELAK